jgi:hypothetical protein
MTDTTNDTSIIENKKSGDSSSSAINFSSKIQGFIISLIAIIAVILLYFSSGSLILFVCKLAQSNILPTEPNCYPYTDNRPNIEKIQTNIFTTFTDPEMSMKLEIPYDNKNSKNKILDIFRDYKNKPSSNFLANYFVSIVENLMSFDYSMINNIMNYLNSMPEAALIGLGPIIVGILFSIGILLNGLYFIYLWIANMSWFFKTNTNQSGEGKPNWENVGITSPVNYGLAIGLVILFMIILFIGFPIISLIPFIIVFYTSFSCLLYKGLLNGKPVSSLSIIANVLKYYKITIVSLISIFLVFLAFSKLGTAPGIFSIITIGLIYWGVISIDIFKPISEVNLTPVVSYEQAKKTCSFKTPSSEKHGFLYNLIFGQKGGANLTNQLKKINKNLSSI